MRAVPCRIAPRPTHLKAHGSTSPLLWPRAAGAISVGYGDHPTDVPFLQACSEGYVVEEMEEYPPGVSYKPPSPFDASALL